MKLQDRLEQYAKGGGELAEALLVIMVEGLAVAPVQQLGNGKDFAFAVLDARTTACRVPPGANCIYSSRRFWSGRRT